MAAFAAAAVVSAAAVLAGCAAPADLDGEVFTAAAPAVPAADDDEPLPVVVDTDLGADDLAALAFLLRHPGVDVRAVTIAATGLVGCDAGPAVLGGLFSALDVAAPPVACGRAVAGPGAHPFPSAWREAASRGSGITPVPGTVTTSSETAVELVDRLAEEEPSLTLLALGPLTNVADVASQRPQAYRRLAAVQSMAGSVAGPVVDGVAEWNAAADPAALAVVLAGPAPLTVVPADAVPPGTPGDVRAPVVDRLLAAADVPAWWDLATAAALVAPKAAGPDAGQCSLDASVPGRLVCRGAGDVRVVRSLDPAALAHEYARAFPD
jgi:hypothetical protein